MASFDYKGLQLRIGYKVSIILRDQFIVVNSVQKAAP